MDEEVRHHVGIDIANFQLRWGFAAAGPGIADQQAEGVAIRCDGMTACFHLDAQAICEEALQQGWECRGPHCDSSAAELSPIRAEASSRSSGTA